MLEAITSPRQRVVYLLESDIEVCESLSLLLRMEGYEVNIFTRKEPFWHELEHNIPDIIVLNSRLVEQSTLPILFELKQRHIGVPIFMLSSIADVDAAVRAMKIGASDFMMLPVNAEHFLLQIRNAFQREVDLGVAKAGSRTIHVRGFSQLTQREREVLNQITNGNSNKEAGRELGISPRTIEVHRARIMEKLGARNTADLVRIVLTS